jgi:hypothetical protein
VSWAKAAYPGDRAIRAAAATPISDSKLGLPSQLAAEYAAAASGHDETEFAEVAIFRGAHEMIPAVIARLSYRYPRIEYHITERHADIVRIAARAQTRFGDRADFGRVW